MTTGACSPSVAANLTCAREPIAFPDAIQPHGVMCVLAPESMVVTGVSKNCVAVFGKTPSRLLGRPLPAAWQTADLRAAVRDALQRPDEPPQHLRLRRQAPPRHRQTFDALVHFRAGSVILEVELGPRMTPQQLARLQAQVRAATRGLRRADDLQRLCTVTVQRVREITGFDRVLIYRLGPTGSGQVICEDRVARAASFLDFHFPESDIPKQARALYAKSPIRAIPDCNYVPVPLVYSPSQVADVAQSTDMSMAILRSLSPRHREYTTDMGVRASLSISLMHEDVLWGLLICGHEAGRLQVSFEARSACSLLCEMMAFLISAKEAKAERLERRRLHALNGRFLERMFAFGDVVSSLCRQSPNLGDLCDNSGAAIYDSHKVYTVRQAPSVAQIRALCEWLHKQDVYPLFATDSLVSMYPPAAAFKHVACGLLAAPLSRAKRSFLLWFRPENYYFRTWAGAPVKETSPPLDQDRPRRSFAAHTHQVALRAKPWTLLEKEAAAQLARMVIDVVLHHHEALQKLNEELSRSNVELDAFAYAASHDLKEPLRGISNFVRLVMDDIGEANLVGHSHYRLTSVLQMVARMRSLIDGLLLQAHVGRSQLKMTAIDMMGIIRRIRLMLQMRADKKNIVLKLSRHFPKVMGDRNLIEQLMLNLATNALKYNDAPHRWIKIGWRDIPASDRLHVFVQDNGIGISEKAYKKIFTIFRRLHGRDQYGGGTGVGLTIAQRIAKRHGSDLFVDSKVGRGSVFSFTLLKCRDT